MIDKPTVPDTAMRAAKLIQDAVNDDPRMLDDQVALASIIASTAPAVSAYEKAVKQLPSIRNRNYMGLTEDADAYVSQRRVLEILHQPCSTAPRDATDGSDGWVSIDELKEQGTFEVWLAEKDAVMDSQFGIAHFHPNITTVNGRFAFDMPKILFFRPFRPAPSSGITAEMTTTTDGS